MTFKYDDNIPNIITISKDDNSITQCVQDIQEFGIVDNLNYILQSYEIICTDENPIIFPYFKDVLYINTDATHLSFYMVYIDNKLGILLQRKKSMFDFAIFPLVVDGELLETNMLLITDGGVTSNIKPMIYTITIHRNVENTIIDIPSKEAMITIDNDGDTVVIYDKTKPLHETFADSVSYIKCATANNDIYSLKLELVFLVQFIYDLWHSRIQDIGYNGNEKYIDDLIKNSKYEFMNLHSYVLRIISDFSLVDFIIENKFNKKLGKFKNSDQLKIFIKNIETL